MFLEAYISARYLKYFQSFVDNIDVDEIVDAKLIKNSQSDSKTISLPAEGDSKSIGENSSQLEATGTCSMVSGEKLL